MRDPFRLYKSTGIVLLFLTPLLVEVGAAIAAPVAPAHLPDLVEGVMPGVVNISATTIERFQVFGMEEFLRGWGVPQERKHASLGSGFIIDKDGFVITNDHVVALADEVVVTRPNKKDYRAKIIGRDQKMDLALLQIRDEKRQVPADLKPVSFGDSDTARIAETVIAVGNPFGLSGTVTVGIISAKNRTIGQGPFDNFIQTDASINPGNSGGPLFNVKGEVIGVNTVIFSRTGQWGGVGFAVPANEVKRILPDLKKYGRVPRPWLGIMAEGMSPRIRRYYDLPSDEGVLIYNLVEGGPALAAGLRQGDIITQVNDQDVKEPVDVEKILGGLKPTDSAKVKIARGRGSRAITVKLRELPRLDNIPRGII
jgi:serine protease Do